MDSAIYPIASPFSVNNIYSSFSIMVVSITPFASAATISVALFDSNGKRLNRVYLELTGDDYSNWVDDYWLLDYVAQKVGVTNPTVAGDY